MRRGAPEGLSEFVRQRLEAMLAEVPPRRLVEAEAAPVVPEEPAASARPNLRLPFDRRHLLVVAALALTAFLWAGWTMLQARTVPVAAAVTAPVASEVAGPTSAPSVVPTSAATPPTVAFIRVHVLGAVHDPGVVRLPAGSRVCDAVEAAGGLLAAAAPAELNLAAILTDGSQVVIGRKGKPRGEVRDGTAAVASGAGQATTAVDLNTATVAQLDSLPGVGPVTAQRILEWRQAHGRFSRIAELQEVDGIGPKTYAQIAPHVRV